MESYKCMICDGKVEFVGEGLLEQVKLNDMRKKTLEHFVERHPSVLLNFMLANGVIQ